MRSLAFKLTLAFLLVSLSGIGLIAVLARQVTASEFDNYQNVQAGQAVLRQLSMYYQNNGSWEGIADQLEQRLRFRLRPDARFVLADANGVVVVPDSMHPLGSRLSDEERQRAMPIVVAGRQVGMVFSPELQQNRILPLLVENLANETDNSQDFLEAVNRSLIIGGVVAAGLSLLLGLFLAWTLTRPLRELTAATHVIAAGNLNVKVPVRSQDELGELAQSFNRMNENLAHASELRRQMTADIAHDLRTPLSIILGHAEALEDGVLPPTPDTFHIIHDEAKRLNRLIEDLRTLSLSEAGELVLHCRLVSTQRLLNRAAAAYAQKAQQQQVDLQVKTEPDLPQINVDPDRITQVLDNLLSNALRYVPPNGRIYLGGRRKDSQVQIIVQDSGSGIAPEDLPHIFDRFYRVDKARKRDQGGSGLGLAIARSIVEAHQGRIWAESEPGKGTRFTIELPLTTPA